MFLKFLNWECRKKFDVNRQVIQAAEAGKHILCEKPIAITLEEVDRMEGTCVKFGVKFMLGFYMRNNVYNKKAKEFVQFGAPGQMVMGRAQLTCWFPSIPGAWRQDVSISHGGSLVDMGTHCLDMLEWIMDTEIVEVAGFQDLLTHKYPTKIEDTFTIVQSGKLAAHRNSLKTFLTTGIFSWVIQAVFYPA